MKDLVPTPKKLRRITGRVATTTFRIPIALKERVEEMAERRGTTVTQIVIQALEDEVTEQPPQWFVNYVSGRKPLRRTPTPKPAKTQTVKQFVLRNPRGVGTGEVAEESGQTVQAAYNTLMLLVEKGIIDRHGVRNRRTWTPHGVLPIAPVDTIDRAIVKVLEDASGEPVDHLTLRDAVTKLVEKARRKPVQLSSVLSKIYRAERKKIIKKVGSGSRGVLYVMMTEKETELRGATKEEITHVTHELN